ncbi:nitrous oxide reductase accessory protein NosL [bacterium]|nr:nitrous oxide reductase accessory protein NosL [bacterium]MBU1989142.1 nitrous oxide reductase accessory protein NosL [bacterium]
MKKIMPIVVIAVLLALIIVTFLSLASSQNMIVIREGNLKMLPLEMELNKYQDSDCGMVIEDLHYASQVIAPNGKTWFFHDHGGFVHWLEDKSFKEDAVIWVMSRDTQKWIDAKKAFYSLRDKTPMGYGFGAYEIRKAAHVDYDTMRLRMLRGETLNNPFIKKQLLGK